MTAVSQTRTRADNPLGKTSEAKTDLARLQEVRRRREAAAAQRQAEQEGKSVPHTLLPSPVPSLDLLANNFVEAAREAAEKKEKANARKL